LYSRFEFAKLCGDMEETNLQSGQPDDRKQALAMLIAGAVIVLSALPLSVFDDAVFGYLEHLGAESLESLMKMITHVGSGVILGAAALIAFAFLRDRRAATRVALSLLAATIVASLLKNIITRQRPNANDFDSFPSGHSIATFSLAGALFFHLRLKAVPFLAVAVLVAFSRLFRSAHYLSDVIAGTGLGLICAGGAALLIREAPRFTRRKNIRIIAAVLAFGFAITPWVKNKNTLSQLVFIVMPPIIFFVFWSYIDDIKSFSTGLVRRFSEKRLLLIIFVIALIAFSMGNWASSLFDRDEGWYGEVAREMKESGDFLTPAYRGEQWLEKPPFPYWLMAGSMAVFGENSFAVRFPSVLAGAFSCVLLYLLAAKIAGQKAALISTGIFATSLLTIFVVRAALMDSILLFLLLLSLLGLWRIARGESSRLPWLMLYGGAGLAFLTKYLAGVAIVGLTALTFMIFTRRWDVLKKARIPTGALLFFAIAGAWFVPAYISTSGELLKVFFEQNVGRSISAMQGHAGPFFYYIVLLPVIFFPWFSFFPAAISQKGTKFAVKSEAWWFLVCWSGGTVLLFSAVSTKLPHYIFPALPPLAILTGALIADAKERSMALSGWKVIFACFFLGLVGISLSIGLIIALEKGGFLNLWRFFAPACAILATACVLALVDFGRRRVVQAVLTLGVGMVVFMLFLVLVALPGFEAFKLAPKIGGRIVEMREPGDKVFHWGYVEPAFTFYAQSHMTIIKSHDAAETELSDVDRAFFILPADEAGNFRKRFGKGYRIKIAYPSESLEYPMGYNTGRGKWIKLNLLLIEKKQTSSE